MQFKINEFYRYLHLKFKILHVDGDILDIRFIGNMIPDHDYCIKVDDDFLMNTVPLLESPVEGYYKRFLKANLVEREA